MVRLTLRSLIALVTTQTDEQQIVWRGSRIFYEQYRLVEAERFEILKVNCNDYNIAEVTSNKNITFTSMRVWVETFWSAIGGCLMLEE